MSGLQINKNPHPRNGRLTQDVGHFVLKVLGGNERIEELFATLDHGVDFSTATTKIGIIIEGFPEIVDRLVSRLGSSVNEDTDFGLVLQSKLLVESRMPGTNVKHLPNGIEEPAMGVDLFLILGLENKDELNRNEIVVLGVVSLREHKLGCGIYRKLGGILRYIEWVAQMTEQ